MLKERPSLSTLTIYEVAPTRFEPDKDTLAFHHFEESQGDLLTDSSGNNHHGKVVTAKWVPGIPGGPSTK